MYLCPYVSFYTTPHHITVPVGYAMHWLSHHAIQGVVEQFFTILLLTNYLLEEVTLLIITTTLACQSWGDLKIKSFQKNQNTSLRLLCLSASAVDLLALLTPRELTMVVNSTSAKFMLRLSLCNKAH